ncbi:MAG: serine/threonine protein kinase [Planctomycetes bacterium]|nr:serine/threonine protein kinase [Planctomycetota bacterium]
MRAQPALQGILPEPQQVPRRFGEWAVAIGLVDAAAVEEALALQTHQRHVLEAAGPGVQALRADRIGEILRRRGHLSASSIRRVLEQQANAGHRSEQPFVADKKPAESETAPDEPAYAGELSDETGVPPSGVSQRRIGDFELLSKLGQGSMGAVYLARQVSNGRKVAIKILPPDLARDQEFLERFRREARAAAKLDHPNIVKAYDVGVASGYHYIAMEYVDGKDLEQGLQRQPHGRYEPAEVRKVAKHMAQALQMAAEHNIVHRDIKPANILKHSDGTYKLTDLGLAAPKAEDQRVTATGVAVGTPYYISPEQARGELSVDPRADIYSLGSTLFHLATGRLPFPGDNAVVVMTAHLTEQVTPPHDLDPKIPKALSRLIEKMMAKSPKDRHQSASELLEDIARIERGEVPLLKRARARARSLASSARSGLRPRESARPADRTHPPSPRKTIPPTGVTAHPRASRMPAGLRRRGASPFRGSSSSFQNFLILAGLVVVALALVYVLQRVLEGKPAPKENVPEERFVLPPRPSGNP